MWAALRAAHEPKDPHLALALYQRMSSLTRNPPTIFRKTKYAAKPR